MKNNAEIKLTIPYIQGEGIGVDITPVTLKVLDAAVEKAYDSKRQIQWQELLAGEKAITQGKKALPDETLAALENAQVALKGPLATSIDQQSINALIRQHLSLEICRRNITDFPGRASLLGREPLATYIVLRHNEEAIDLGPILVDHESLCLPTHFEQVITDTLSVSSHYWSKTHIQKLVEKGIKTARDSGLENITLVHRAPLLPQSEGLFLQWSQDWLEQNYSIRVDDQTAQGGSKIWWLEQEENKPLKIQFLTVESFLQRVVSGVSSSQVVLIYNRYGDAVSDVLAAQTGGIGVVPTGHFSSSQALFEPTHGTAPKHAGQDKVNPTSLILAGEMMLRHLEWNEAADLVQLGVKRAIDQRMLTIDLAKQVSGVTAVSCSQFGNAVINAIRNG